MPKPSRRRLDHPALPELFTRADAHRAGLTDRQIDYRLSTGFWVRERRGVFRLRTGTANPVPRVEDAAARTAIMSAAMTVDGRGLAVSHQSACLIYGLPGPLRGWGMPTFSGDRGPTRRRDDVHVLVGPLAPGDIWTTPSGLAVTSPARTVSDCLRSLHPADALAVADAAARRGVHAGSVREVIQRQRGWPGVVRAREVLGLIDPHRESPLESWSAWAFHEWAVPQPLWQVDLFTATGAFCGRVDSWWQAGLAGEADGRAKYALAAAERGGADARRLSLVLDAERTRERRIERAGAELVRWGSRDVRGRGRADLAQHVNRRLLHARRSASFRGRAVPASLVLPEPTLAAPGRASRLWARGA